MNKQSCEQQSFSRLIKHFISGAIVGIFLALIYWSYSIYSHSTPSIAQGIMGSLILAIGCGAIATFISFEKLMDNLPPL